VSNDALADQTAEGWTIRFVEATVTQLLVDYRFTMKLAGGALIVLEEPFTLHRNELETRVPPGEAVYEVADALPLFNRQVELARAETSGQLRVVFLEGPEIDVPVNPAYENWQIVMPDGEQWVGTPGGGIAHYEASD
jgi:hypothetical protein